MGEAANLLEVKNIVKSFGKTQVLKSVDFTLKAGEVHALLGGNGAGKSTLISMIGGARQPDTGTITVNNEVIQFSSPRDSLRKGIAVVYQELSVLPHLTVAENISMGNDRSVKKGLYDWNNARKEAVLVLKLLGGSAEEIDEDALVSTLRTDQQQLVEIARAVNLGAKVILLDEPTSSLNYEETQHLFDVIRQLRKQGIGFIFVSHRLNEIREISNRITIIRDGRTVLDGVSLKEISDSKLISEMLGRSFSVEQMGIFKGKSVDSKEETLKVVFEQSPLSLSLKKGEVIGIAGLAGSGRSALLRHIWGDQVRKDIELYLNGEKYKPKNPKTSIQHGVAYIGEDRRVSGLFLNLPLNETLMMANRSYRPSMLVSTNEESQTKNLIDLLKVKVPSIESLPSELSGGNQQKLLFGRWLLTNPKLLLLDEPTRGVDVSTKVEIYKLIQNLTEKGASVIVVSSEISELVTLSNKVVIINNGLPSKILTDDAITEELIQEAVSKAN